MLDKNIFLINMKKLATLYGNRWNVDFDNAEDINIWYEQFKHFGDRSFEKTVQNYINNERFAPTVSGLLDYKTDYNFRPESVEITEDDYY